MTETNDGTVRFVRVRKSERAGYVNFDFAINHPELSVELILPKAAFIEFCEANNVVFMTPEQGVSIDIERLKWRYGKDASGRADGANGNNGNSGNES
ncbi:phenol hydroxylase subunit [Thauera sp. 63]|jgi:phenol hydroxylase P0 protein|uniref:phenol hydroxylase subunit n=1 Tax=Thauera sp. 63 TaxID=497321 RepID=UPI0002CDEAB1|nr:phenol hydroxylase subunit [Thauera sp. 63]ENO79113.1 phenol hydrolase assembly protein [Thauera sp. 63]